MPSVLQVLSLAALAACSPYSSPVDEYARALNSRQASDSVTATQLDTFKYYVQHAGAAYCNADTRPGNPIVCSNQVCNDVRSTVYRSFSGTASGIGGYITVDDNRREIVISIRGSSNVRNFANDVSGVLIVPCFLTTFCAVHAGFAGAWTEITDAVTEGVKSAVQSNPGYTIVATGHSLGAAVATLAAAYLRVAGFPMDLYTYGSPRVGNGWFAEFVTKQAGAEYRVTHTIDPIPRLGPLTLTYRHTSPEYWIYTGNSTTTEVGVRDIKICDGYANLQCNGGTGGFDMEAHRHYFEATTSCGNSGIPIKRDGAADDALAAKVEKWSEEDKEFAKHLNQGE